MKGWRVTATEGVEIIFEWGPWRVDTSWPEKTRRTDIASIIRIEHHGSAPPRLVLSSSRINILSTSAKQGVAKAMRDASLEDKELTDQFVHDIAERVMVEFKKAGQTVKPKPRQRRGDRWLLYPVWPATQGTLIAAGTNTFKSMIGVAVAAQASCGAEILQGNTRANGTVPVLFLDWEADEADFSERLYAVLRGAGVDTEPCVPYRQLTIPLVDAVDTIAEEIARQGYGGVVIDSLSAACGGSLVDDELANGFWNAVSRLHVPALVTAHKSASALSKGDKRAFGSVMHENRSRMLWDARRDGASGQVLWEVVSDNNTGLTGNRLAWDIQIDREGEDETRRLDRVRFVGVNPNDVRIGANEGNTLADRMVYAIVSGGDMTTKELATAVGTTDSTVRTQLNRHGDLFGKHPDGLRWGLK